MEKTKRVKKYKYKLGGHLLIHPLHILHKPTTTKGDTNNNKLNTSTNYHILDSK